MWELDQDVQRNQSKIRQSFQLISFFFTISGNFVTGYSVPLCSVGWLNSREMILCVKVFHKMVLWPRGCNPRMEKDCTGSVPWQHHPAQYLVPQILLRKRKRDYGWVNFPSGHFSLSQQVRDWSLPVPGVHPRLSS